MMFFLIAVAVSVCALSPKTSVHAETITTATTTYSLPDFKITNASFSTENILASNGLPMTNITLSVFFKNIVTSSDVTSTPIKISANGIAAGKLYGGLVETDAGTIITPDKEYQKNFSNIASFPTGQLFDGNFIFGIDKEVRDYLPGYNSINNIKESNEDNNIFTLVVTTNGLSSSSKPDLYVKDIIIEQGGEVTNPKIGKATIKIIYSNLSSAQYVGQIQTHNNFLDAKNFLKIDNLGNVSQPVLFPDQAHPLFGANTFVEYYTGTFLKAGTTSLETEVDFGNNISEVNETNNKLAKVITVVAAPVVVASTTPTKKNSKTEQVGKERFFIIYKRVPDMSDAKDNKAVMTIAYNQPQPKTKINSKAETGAIAKFKIIHKHKPTTTLDWSEVRALAYSGALIKKDSDNDGLDDAYEKKLGTNPKIADTDGDGHNDGVEVLKGYDPLKK